MLRVGLTGGIASGKSTAAARLAELGAAVVDHDLLAREVLGPGTRGLRAVVHAFGPEVLDADGALDRAALAAVVFGDLAARERLNAVVHPRVRWSAGEREAELVAEGHHVVVHDIPLLVETGQAGHFDVLVVVDAPAELRVRRLVDGRGLTEQDAWARVAAQAADDERRAAADVVLDGSQRVSDLYAQVDELWRGWRQRAPAASPAPRPTQA
ncbi:dephospho-CoA kinase [Actinotalea sp. C106]|uniref:dephospho-CoA kinase n=1 Tax=Actinotalea sp. C106 TaxID=2908644 RepID=UPI0020295BD7|nr:dephospho-CoA kinase [Actinotalea sp. C106]